MVTPEEEEKIIKDIRTEGAVRKGAESRLYHTFKEEFIKRGSYKYGLINHDANEAYDNAIIAVIENIRARKYEPRSGKSLEGYAATIFCYKCIDIVRRTIEKSEPINKSLVEKLPDRSTDVIGDIIGKELLSKIHNCYQKIGEGCKKVLMLSTEKFKDKEIAEIMSYNSEDVAKQKRYACLRKLRDCLSPATYG